MKSRLQQTQPEFLAALELRRIMPIVPLRPVLAGMPSGTEFIGFDYGEPTLVFYSGHTWRFEREWEPVRKRLEAPGPRCVVCLRREFKFDETIVCQLKSGADMAEMRPTRDHSEQFAALSLPGYQRIRVQGLSVERQRWVELEVMFGTGR